MTNCCYDTIMIQLKALGHNGDRSFSSFLYRSNPSLPGALFVFNFLIASWISSVDIFAVMGSFCTLPREGRSRESRIFLFPYDLLQMFGRLDLCNTT